MIALVGASGSGKSTLMNILGGLDVPSAGRAIVAGHDLTRMDGRARTAYRRRVVGFIWQQTERNLLGHLSAAENVELPMLLDGVSARERRQRATLLMDLVGVPVARRRAGLPTELSGGEQQRVAVAIALANQPPVLLADEPTGELDGATAAQLLTALRRVNAELGTTDRHRHPRPARERPRPAHDRHPRRPDEHRDRPSRRDRAGRSPSRQSPVGERPR